ncbi:thiolase family protein [Streptomyces sp. NPDC058001]|uniref:thiolase family protein n=1 Tax=Streptomyces sp. NPDC058001 TaxID=3346300 RepID=UPI0036EE19FE
MPEAVLVSALRTPIGTAVKGTLRDTTAYDLAHHILTAAADGLDPDRLDGVVLGEGLYGGGVVARHAALTAGLASVPGTANNRHCAAGLAAVEHAAASIRSGMDELVIAGGVNSASTAPVQRFRTGGEWADWYPPTHPDRPDAPNMDMAVTIGWNTAVAEGVSRADMDAWALRSHRNAVRAIDEGRFDAEIVPIRTPHGLFSVDEHPRRTTSLDKLASLKPLHPEIDGFSITAGNSSGGNDGAAALVVAADTTAARDGLPVLATIRSWASVGVDPAETGMAPALAIPKALARAGLSASDVDLYEINEAFAAMCVAVVRRLDLDPDRVNVNGSGCSLGHPVAATGARMLVTLVHELRRTGGGIGVAALCAGGGMASAMVVEVSAP